MNGPVWIYLQKINSIVRTKKTETHYVQGNSEEPWLVLRVSESQETN